MTRCLLIVPAYNEALLLEQTLTRLWRFMGQQAGLSTRIVIADCSDRDATREIARQLAGRLDGVVHMEFSDGAGKGLKIRQATLAHANHDVFAFIDADLPIGEEQLLRVIEGVTLHGANLCVGSKYVAGGGADRPWYRSLASRVGNRVFNQLLRLPVHDFLAGAKAWDRQVTEQIWPRVRDDQFFFDAELMYLAHRRGLTLREEPVVYVDHRTRGSKVNVGLLGLEFMFKTGKLLLRRG